MSLNSSLYPVTIQWSDDDGGFIAIVPDLPGCSAFGLTRDVAVAEANFAIEAWIEAAVAAGNEIPVPSRLPEPATYSGRVLVRMPSALHQNLSREAQRQRVSLNQFIVYVLADGFAHIRHENQGVKFTKNVISTTNFIGLREFERVAVAASNKGEMVGAAVITSPANLVLGVTGHA